MDWINGVLLIALILSFGWSFRLWNKLTPKQQEELARGNIKPD